MDNNEQKTNKTFVGASLDPELVAVLDRMRAEEDRTMSNMISVLLKTHQRVQPMLEAETAGAGA